MRDDGKGGQMPPEAKNIAINLLHLLQQARIYLTIIDCEIYYGILEI